MNIEVRIYRRYDIDIYSLCDAGFPVFTMIKEAITAYAHSAPLHYLIDNYIPFEFNDNQKLVLHSRIHIPDSDTQTIHLLKSVKSGLRNSFCKTMLRNALLSQNMCGYFTDRTLISLYNTNLNLINVGIPGTRPLSLYKRDSYNITFAGKTVTVKNKKTKKLQEFDVRNDATSKPSLPVSHDEDKITDKPTASGLSGYYSPVLEEEDEDVKTDEIKTNAEARNNGIIETTDTMDNFMDAFDAL